MKSKMTDKNVQSVVKNAARFQMQAQDLMKWCDLIAMEDMTEAELKNLDVALHNAANEAKKVNEVFYEACKRCKDEGRDLMAESERKKIRQEILTPLTIH